MYIGQYCGLYTAVHWDVHLYHTPDCMLECAWDCTLDNTPDCTLHCTLGCTLVLYTRCAPDVAQMCPNIFQMCTFKYNTYVFHMLQMYLDVFQMGPDISQICTFQMGSRCISNVFQMCLDLFQMCTWAIHCTLDCT